MLRRFPSLPDYRSMSGAPWRLKQRYCFLTGEVTREGGGEERTGSGNTKRPLGVGKGEWDGISAVSPAGNEASESRTLVGKWLVAASHKTGRREARHVTPPDFSSDFLALAHKLLTKSWRERACHELGSEGTSEIRTHATPGELPLLQAANRRALLSA